MGWWNESIYGGDAPLEWKENIYELCKTKEYGKGDKPKAITKKNLLKNMDAIRNMIDTVGFEDEEDMNIGYQILGAICMHSGYDLLDSPGLKEKIIEAIENDEWAKENGLRQNACKNFKKLVKDYDFNTPVNVETINIFEDLEEEDEESIAKEFQEVFSLINARIKKLRNGIEEKSGVKEFDEGYETAAEEEISFLTDFKELVARQEMMGVLLERIKNGSIGSGSVSNEGAKMSSGGQSTDAGRADVSPG
jgi:hypothetical protein